MAGFEQTTPITVGRVLSGRYRLVAPIARGGMAEVWEAHDGTLSRAVAVKLLQPHLAADAVFLERFRREAITAARLAHPGIVATYDTGLDEGTAFIVMELVRGRNLRQVLSDHGPLESGQAVAVTRQVADALSYAHQAGLVHRDIKPANVLLVEEEWGGLRAKVTDFGIAKASAGLDQDLTRTGTVLGTPKYLSPEQIRGDEPDPRADLYSLGVVFFEMLVGSPPYAGETDMATALAHLHEPVPRPSSRARGIPVEVDRVVCDLLAKNPQQRVPSAGALRQRLDGMGPLPSSRTKGKPAKWSLRGRAGGPDGPGPAPHTTALPDPRSALPNTVASPARRPAGPVDHTMVDNSPAHPRTDEMAVATELSRRHRRNERMAGLVVLALVLTGAIVSAVLYATHRPAAHRGASSVSNGPTVRIGSVQVYMVVPGRSPDDPQDTPKTFDGDPSTFWETDHYRSPTFGNLYPGIGLEIALDASAKLDQLSVTTGTQGWAAQVYVADSQVDSGQPVSAWGSPTDGKSNISGNTTFSLGGRTAKYVLLFLTNLGPAQQAQVNELSVR